MAADAIPLGSIGPLFSPRFSEGFLNDHAGSIIADPQVAIVELVANAWDAGATAVDISWFPDNDLVLVVSDNGTGMTVDEFANRWTELSYNRIRQQGDKVEVPAGNVVGNRRAYGRNGKGRHGMFHFADSYIIETARYGKKATYKVGRAFEGGVTPFSVEQTRIEDCAATEHGTRLTAVPDFEPFTEEELRKLLGSKFISDPGFRIQINGRPVELTDLGTLVNREEIEVPGAGNVTIWLVDTETRSRTMRQHGVAWWVNKRLARPADWRKLSGEPYLDGRTSEAKQYTFIVEADILLSAVKEDWSGFRMDDALVTETAIYVERYIEEQLSELLSGANADKKRAVLETSRQALRPLSPNTRLKINEFVDKIVDRFPNIRSEYLSEAVTILANLEKSRFGYELLTRLAMLNPDELDDLNDILTKWSVTEANFVLDLLWRRLQLLEKLERLVDDPTADELHQLQPLFNAGLWIFGPEYESPEFTSNRQLITVLKTLFGDSEPLPELPGQRPDFVVLPDSSLGVYTCDRFGDDAEVDGLRAVLIIELKRGGFALTTREINQAEEYILRLRQSGKVTDATKITAFVLGSTLNEFARMMESKRFGHNNNSLVHALSYSTIIRRAHARMFKLQEKLTKLRRESEPWPSSEEDLEQGELGSLYGSNGT